MILTSYTPTYCSVQSLLKLIIRAVVTSWKLLIFLLVVLFTMFVSLTPEAYSSSRLLARAVLCVHVYECVVYC